MSGAQGGGRLCADCQYFLQRQRPFGQAPPNGFADHPFLSNKKHAIRLADFVNRDDVGMIESGCGARLLLKAAHVVWIAGEARRQQLQGDLAIQIQVSRQPNFADTAGAEVRDHLIMFDAMPCQIARQWASRHVAGELFEQGLFQKMAGLRVGIDQRVDLLPQFVVAPADSIEERNALVGPHLQGGVGERVDLPISFWRHARHILHTTAQFGRSKVSGAVGVWAWYRLLTCADLTLV